MDQLLISDNRIDLNTAAFMPATEASISRKNCTNGHSTKPRIPVINSAITKSVEPQEVGGALGLASALESLTRVIGPVLGGFVLDELGTWAPGVVAAVLAAWLVFYVWQSLLRRPELAQVNA